MSRALKFAFILDPLAALTAYKDSSIAMMRAAAARGHQVWALQRGALTWRDSAVVARALPIRLLAGDAPWFEAAGAEQALALTEFDAVMMRQDPPFDFEYITATWLLVVWYW